MHNLTCMLENDCIYTPSGVRHLLEECAKFADAFATIEVHTCRCRSCTVAAVAHSNVAKLKRVSLLEGSLMGVQA